MLLETEEVISEGFQSSKSTRLQNGAIRKVALSLKARCQTLHGVVLPCNVLSCSKAVNSIEHGGIVWPAQLICTTGCLVDAQRHAMQVWDEHVEVTSDLMLTHFLFSLPLDAPASFATHLVALRWVLRFEFTTSAAKPAGWLSGGSSPEQIVWSLPVLVRPPVAFA